MEPSQIFEKTLSLNDTGETGSHMAGILIPKRDLAFFPPLDASERNPRTIMSMRDHAGREWNLNYIYYNSALFDGTRDEYRLTGLTEFIRTNELSGGDKIQIAKLPDAQYILGYERAVGDAVFDIPQSVQTELPLSQDVSSQSSRHDHALRPAARIIHTIGENLIKDPQAAVMELVKNAYDADAENVSLEFQINTSQSEIRITVRDDGHGMSYDQVVNAWLVPATDNKAKKVYSPKGRYLQGNKGIGRFAAFMLGSEIFLTTVSSQSLEETSLLLQASDFREVAYLDQVRVMVDKREVSNDRPSGSAFEMTSAAGDESFKLWGRDDFKRLVSDLERMLFPFKGRRDDFNVQIHYHGFESLGQIDGKFDIEPLPIYDFFDYRINVQVSSDGVMKGYFSTPLVAGTEREEIEMILPDLKGSPCGLTEIDFRAVDREPTAIQDILDRANKAGDQLAGTGKAQLKRLLNEACGVSVYRGDFRIRPYGDHGNDWLELDRQRINNPSFNIGNNQAFGTVVIEAESESNLQEKSARDGLRENEEYERLRDVVSRAIRELERRRFEIRRATGRIQRSTPVAQMLKDLGDYERSFDRISKLLATEGIARDKVERIHDILRADAEGRNEIIAKLENTIAIYQGQATLGKMVGVLLHEGNRAVGILKNQGIYLPRWIQKFEDPSLSSVAQEVVLGLKGVSQASETLISLFNSIQPLGVRSRRAPKPVGISGAIAVSLNAFQSRLTDAGIDVSVEVPAEFKVIAWDADLHTIFLNLIENSIHWLTISNISPPAIRFYLDTEGSHSVLHFRDNGPGIPREHILSEAIFEPNFSLKGGLGLGLPIAGECAARNNFELKAVYSSNGAHFELDFGKQESN